MPPKPNQPHNPHASAAGAYGMNAQKHSEDPREIEARALLKSAQFMQDLQNNWESADSEIIQETLKYNRDIWMMFYDTAVENPGDERPKDLRNNIYNLANFIFKREVDILAKPEKKKFDILISINRDIAAGLMEGIKNDRAAAAKAAPAAGAPASSTATDADAKKPPSGGWNSSA